MKRRKTWLRVVGEFAESGLVNLVGGCCGTRPEHIAALKEAIRNIAAADRARGQPVRCRLSGLEPLNIGPDDLFVNVGERCNVTGSAIFRRLIEADDYAAAVQVARHQVENGAQVIDVNMDEGMLDSEQAMVTFLNLIAAEPDVARLPIMIDSSKWSVIEAGLRCVQGKAVVNSISLKEGEESFIAQARKLVRAYGAAVIVMAFDEQGQADTIERKVNICRTLLRNPDRANRFSTPPISFSTRTYSPIATGIEEHSVTASRSSMPRERSRRSSLMPWCRVASAMCRSRFAATMSFVKPSTRYSCTTRFTRGHGYGHRQCRTARDLRGLA